MGPVAATIPDDVAAEPADAAKSALSLAVPEPGLPPVAVAADPAVLACCQIRAAEPDISEIDMTRPPSFMLPVAEWASRVRGRKVPSNFHARSRIK